MIRFGHRVRYGVELGSTLSISTALLRDQSGMSVAVDAIEGEIRAVGEIFKRIWEKMPWRRAEGQGAGG